MVVEVRSGQVTSRRVPEKKKDEQQQPAHAPREKGPGPQRLPGIKRSCSLEGAAQTQRQRSTAIGEAHSPSSPHGY